MYASIIEVCTDGGDASGMSRCWFPTRTKGFVAAGLRRKASSRSTMRFAAPAETRIALVAGLRERRGRGLAEDQASHADRFQFRASARREFVQEVRVLVLGEQAEEHPARERERRRLTVPAVLEQSTDRGDRADPLMRVGAAGRHREDQLPPRAVRTLRERERERGRVREGEHREQLRRRERPARHLCNGAILYWY